MSSSLLIYLFILLTSLQYVLHSKEMAMVKVNEDAELQSDGRGYNRKKKQVYVCARTKATTKATRDCPLITKQSRCELKKFDCKWILEEDNGYCSSTGAAAGNTGSIDKLCSKQVNKANCINKITSTSGNCQWLAGYPPTPSPTDISTTDTDIDDEEQSGLELESDGRGYKMKRPRTTAPPMCCAPSQPKNRWIKECEGINKESRCELATKKCKWIECADVGYCEWNGNVPGRNDALDKICSRATNRAVCNNKVTSTSGNCQWISEYPNTFPPDQDMDDMEEEEMLLALDINNMIHTEKATTSSKSFYSIEFMATSLFLVSVCFILYKQCCISEYKSADKVLLEMEQIDERKDNNDM